MLQEQLGPCLPAASDNESRSIVNTHLIIPAQRVRSRGITKRALSFYLVHMLIYKPRHICLCLACRMWLTLLYSCAGGAALLYALYRWVIPTVVKIHPELTLLWHDKIVEWILDRVTRSTRPQVGLSYAVFAS